MYKTVAEFAELWQVTERTVRNYCAQGKIPGAVRENKAWMLPADTRHPSLGGWRPIGIGMQNFADLIEKKCFYVDKTHFIKEWWESNNHVTAIMRPRRFGKTLTMSMVEKFFSVKYPHSQLFKGLAIWKHSAYRDLQGTYPVIFLSFAAVKERDYASAIERIKSLIVNVYTEYYDLLDGDTLTPIDKEFFSKVTYDMSDTIAVEAIGNLCSYLYAKYGKKVIILLDEYDTPMQEAFTNNYWDKMSGFTRNFFNVTFKTNAYLERGLMTGITRFSKESIFSDLNNLEVVTASSSKYADVFGFTEAEVISALEEYGLPNMQEVKEWYDGFTFGGLKDIYNPWSIINYLDKRHCELYWANTSSNGLVAQILMNCPRDVKIDFEKLLQRQTVCVNIDEQITFHDIHCNVNTIWSLLLATGYLKILQHDIISGIYEVALTNKETQVLFTKIVKNWFSAATYDYQGFLTAIITGDEESANYRLNNILEATLSFFDTAKKPENFYHGFVLGLLVYLEDRYYITSNRESGLGRYDVMLEAKSKESTSLILEFKVAKTVSSLKEAAMEALEQIEKKNYALALTNRGFNKDNILKYGIAFRGKRSVVKLGHQ